VQSLQSLSSVDPGFQARNLLLVSGDPGAAGYDRPRIHDFWQRTVERVSQINGAQSVSLARTVPLAPGRVRQPLLDPTAGAFVEIDTNFVGPRYFRTLGIPMIVGREFGEEDQRTSRPVVIVNDRLARMLWPDQDPIGKGVRIARDREELRHKGPLPAPRTPLLEVVGVVKGAKYRDLRGEAEPMLYRPYSQSNSSDPMALHVRAASDATVLAQTIRREIEILDANVPLFGFKTLEDQLDASFAQTRQAAVLTGAFGVLALLLSGVGIYGVTALAVCRRTQEIGIRMALGAGRSDIVRTISRRGLILVFVGLGLGLAGSFGFTQLAGALMYGVTPSDAATFVAMSLLLIVVSLCAIYVPATGATRLDAVAAIRTE
jgi:putative ABC transport system permease protein